MNDYIRQQAGAIPAGRADMAVDAGLRSFMLGVYNKMALGLVVSAALAYAVANFPPVRDLLKRLFSAVRVRASCAPAPTPPGRR